MTEITRWFEYGEPTDDDERVEATIRWSFQTGPNEPSRKDELKEGTIGYEALDMMENDEEIKQHTHDDDSVMLSGLSKEKEEQFLETFEEE
jgi:hypothetical protein